MILAILMDKCRETTNGAHEQLNQIMLVFKPDTVLRLHRELVRRKWTFSRKGKPGRPKIPSELDAPIVRLAKENTRWGRIAVYVAMVVPVLYALARYAWALGIPVGISEELLRSGQERGMWTSGLFLATFGLVGAVLSLGLVQRWGELFPRWMISLAGGRVPITLAVVPASIVPVLLMVGDIAMWSGYAQMVAEAVAGGTEGAGIVGEAPTALFPVWGAALAVGTLGYYYRRRGPCEVCGRGAPG